MRETQQSQPRDQVNKYQAKDFETYQHLQHLPRAQLSCGIYGQNSVATVMAESSGSLGSQTPMETTEIPAQTNPEAVPLTAEQTRAMKNITERIYAYREPE